MAKISSVKVDKKKEEEGVWMDWLLDMEVKVARMGNTAYRKALVELSGPEMDAVMAGAVDSDVREKVQKQAAAKSLITGWRGFEDDEGKPIPFSHNKAVELFLDPGFEHLYQFVLVMSNNVELFFANREERAEKN